MRTATWTPILLVLLVLPACDGDPEGADAARPPPDLSSPEAAVTSFAEALRIGDPDRIRFCLASSTVDPTMKALFWRQAGPEVIERLAASLGDMRPVETVYENPGRTMARIRAESSSGPRTVVTVSSARGWIVFTVD